MKIESNNSNVIHNMPSATALKAELNSVTFRMFSDMIYENKIGAIVREVISNAVDSHLMASTERDVEVHIPTYIDPKFIVEDFGVGMDYDDFVAASTYCSSNKRDSDEAIGGWGVGFKSPFAHVSEFQVRTRKNGREAQYLLFMNQYDEPSFQKLYEKEINEPNGVRVEVPVDSLSFDQFRTECEHYLSFFKGVKVVNDDSFQVRYDGVIEQMEERGYAIIPSNEMQSKCYAIMGGVPYRIELSNFINFYSPENGVIRKIYQYNNIFIKFDLGELKVALSRETLSLDDKTKNAVKEKIQHIIQKIVDDIQSTVDSLNSIHEKVDYIYNISKGSPLIDYIIINGKVSRYYITRRFKIGRAIYYNLVNHRRPVVRAYSTMPSEVTAYQMRANNRKLMVFGRGSEKDVKGFLQYAKMYIKEHCKSIYDTNLVIDKEFVVTDTFLNRLEVLFGVKPEFVSSNELKNMYKSPSDSSRSGNSDGVRRDDNQVSAVSCVWKERTGSYVFNRFRKDEHTIEKNDETLYLHDTYLDERVYSIDGKNTGISCVCNFIAFDTHLDGRDYKKIVIFKSNKNNIKKIERNGIKSVDHYLDNFLNVDRLKEMAGLVSDGDSRDIWSILGGTNSRFHTNDPIEVITNLVDLFDKVESNQYNDIIGRFKEIIQKRDEALKNDYLGLIDVTLKTMTISSSLIDQKVLDDIKNLFSDFPLISGIATSFNNDIIYNIGEYAVYIDGKIEKMNKESLALAS